MINLLTKQQQILSEKEPNIASFFVSIDALEMGTLPFLPIGVFRRFHVFQANAPIYSSFSSSGSTNDVRAKHSFSERGLERYRIGSSNNFKAFLSSIGVAPDASIVSLVPPVSKWPHSSLAAMIDMFKQEALNIAYLDVESKELDLAQLGSTIDVVFGTSIHHCLLAEHPQRGDLAPLVHNKSITVIDTGGTKGRTRSLTLQDTHDMIRATYPSASNCNVVSEYGMCELASQAWSLHAPHDGWFRANDTLLPLIVDIDKRRIISETNTPGFLAFIDRSNHDSYMAIITEDLAIMDDRPGCFKLVGRAPDASIKGCSLNVKENHHSDKLAAPAEPIVFCSDAPKNISTFQSLVCTLPSEVWSEDDKQDLILALKSVQESTLKLERTRENQRVLFVLSANIPITFLYPAFVCALRGVKEIHLQLPSTRGNDAYSERVRLQISSLAEVIAPFLHPTSIHLHPSKDLVFSQAEQFDAIVVFGTDETIRTFQTNCHTEVIGLGSVQNAVFLNAQSNAKEIAQQCARWLGRGCLTPVALVGDDPYLGFVDELALAVENEFARRLRVSGFDQKFFHRHAWLEVQSIFKMLGANPNLHIRRYPNVFVIDLRCLDAAALVESGFTFNSGGCGLVYLITVQQFEAFEALKSYPTDPGFQDNHMDKPWMGWI